MSSLNVFKELGLEIPNEKVSTMGLSRAVMLKGDQDSVVVEVRAQPELSPEGQV